MFKKFLAVILVLGFVGVMNAGVVFADDDDSAAKESAYEGLLPKAVGDDGKNASVDSCRAFFTHYSLESQIKPLMSEKENVNYILGCGITTGNIHMWMIPYFIKYILEFVIGISGLICVGGIVYGGFVYIFSGMGEEKDKGKKALMYSILGLVLTLLAWAIVNLVIALVTT